MKGKKISDCMGISEENWDATEKIAETIYNESSLVSEALTGIGDAIKSEEFGNGFELSDFEKRLLIGAFIVGIHREREKILKALQSDPSAILRLLLGK
jgi:hypothetical protein